MRRKRHLWLSSAGNIAAESMHRPLARSIVVARKLIFTPYRRALIWRREAKHIGAEIFYVIYVKATTKKYRSLMSATPRRVGKNHIFL